MSCSGTGSIGYLRLRFLTLDLCPDIAGNVWFFGFFLWTRFSDILPAFAVFQSFGRGGLSHDLMITEKSLFVLPMISLDLTHFCQWFVNYTCLIDMGMVEFYLCGFLCRHLWELFDCLDSRCISMVCSFKINVPLILTNKQTI